MYQLHVRVAALAVVALIALFASGEDRVRSPAPHAAAANAYNYGQRIPTPDALLALNEASRAAYRRAREEALAHCGPVVLLEGDDLVLVYGLYRTTAHITPDVYHTLKSISHIPLALHALLDGRAGGALDERRIYDLKQYRILIDAAVSGLGDRGLSAEQLKQAKVITGESLAFIARIIEARQVEGKDLDAYRRRMRPLIDASVAEAARAQIDALHRQMKAWKGRLTEAEWRQLHVIVMGKQLPRPRNMAVQYFARLLGEAGEGERIVYAEGIFDEALALDLLGTRLLDTRIGVTFFDDPSRMYRDLLSDAATQYLDELFPKTRP
jgi:hypothetical protein